MPISLKRVYDRPAPGDGTRILVERLWPRGLTKDKAAIDHWAKDISPSPELRRWYGHDPAKWPEFQTRYRKELEGKAEELGKLAKECGEGQVTFVFAAKDEKRCSAAVLKAFVEENYGL